MWRGLLLAIGLLAASPPVAAAQATDLTVDASTGHYTLVAGGLRFAGDVGQPLSNVNTTQAQDALGQFTDVEFSYPGRTSSIKSYPSLGAVLFSTTYTQDGPNAEPFPKLTSRPTTAYSLSYFDKPFSPYQFNSLDNAADSPWLFFNTDTSGFVISPADNFPVARLSSSPLASGIDASIAALPKGFTYRTVLVAGTGLNHLFDVWGNALTTLYQKPRPANDADLTLQKFGYWTDNGAVYYYHFEPPLGYAGTLQSVINELDQRGIKTGYVQLDSWWYPKGPNALWQDKEGGIFHYRAAPDLFPDGLSAFQQSLGLPLVTHARWIDPASPYRGQFSFSGNVMTDQRYWSELMGYLRQGNVVTYEQDWLGAQAQPVYDLSAPEQFMGNMASAANQNGLTLQYCMPLPRHVLQTLAYPNVTTVRVSDDRFDRNRWDTFLYTSRFASALGVWPWSDVFMSTERNNLLLSVLSAGVVGVGDALGAANVDNLQRVMRADAVLIKPDAALVPTDDSIVNEAAHGPTSPVLAWTYSDHAAMRALYLFAYGRPGSNQATATVTPAKLGMTGPVTVYDYFAGTAQLHDASDTIAIAAGDGTYDVVVPVGPSGIAFLGDNGAYATLGRTRIATLSDDGTLAATVEFAPGEQNVTLFGYAPSAPSLTATGGTAGPVSYDSSTGRFTVQVSAGGSQVSVELSL